MDKWLLVSCLQKSIRRGFIDIAQNYVQQLWEIEPSYLLYRLSIIAVEDIGLGNLELVNEFVSTEIRKNIIKEKGGLDYLLNITEQLCLSKKDRTACDLGHLAKYTKFLYLLEPLDILKNTNDSLDTLVQKSLAMWYLCGTKKFKNEQFESEENLEKLFNFFNPSQEVASIVKHANLFQREPIAYNLLLLEKQFDLEKNLVSGKWKTGNTVDKKFEQDLIHGFLFEGVDKHTFVGKKCLEKLINQSLILQDALKNIPKGQWADYLGYVQFRSDSEHVDKRLFYPTAIKIYHGCRQHKVEEYKNVSNAYLKEKHILRNITQKNLPYNSFKL